MLHQYYLRNTTNVQRPRFLRTMLRKTFSRFLRSEYNAVFT